MTEAAESVGVARSTAHRLLAMLIHHGFAEQREDRRYHVGPILRSAVASSTTDEVLRQASARTIERLVARVGETVTLQVLDGTKVRVISTVECDKSLRIGSRTNRVMEARETSGGKALLALLPDAEIRRRLSGTSAAEMRKLMAAIDSARECGYATNDQESEVGVSAIGIAIPNRPIESTAAITIAIPTMRVGKRGLGSMFGPLQEAVAEVARSLPSAARTSSR